MLILKQNAANTVPTPAAGKGTIFLSDSDVLSVKNSSGNVEAFPTIGGANTQVIFNDDAALGGSANYTFDKTTNVLTVTGNIGATRVLTDNLLYANGVAWDLTQPAGSNTEIQYNDGAGGFGASSNFTFDDATNILNVTGEVSATTLTGTLSTATQTNITSVGTLTSLTVNGNAGVTNISATGEVAGDTLSITSDAVIGGNLNVNGNLTYVNVESFAVEDPIISMGGGPNGAAPTSNDGKDRGTQLQYYTSEALQAFMGWDSSAGHFAFGSDVSLANEVVTFNTYGDVKAESFIGNGASLSDITGANVTGEVSYAATANAVAGANVSGEVSYAATANAVAGANVSGQVGNALVAGTVYTNAQPNITSVGTLSTLFVADGASGDYSSAKMVVGHGDSGVTSGDWAAIVGEAIGNSSNSSAEGTGIIGSASTNGGTKGTGVKGIATVSDTSDTGAAVGVRGLSTSTHASGYNIGLFGAASGSSINNYALYLKDGGIASIEANVAWDLYDNSNAALTFSSTGKGNIFLIETTDNAEGIATSGYLNVTGNATVGGIKTDNYYYANGAPLDFQQPAGSNTQVIYNDNGDFGASANFTFNSSTNTLAVNNVNATSLTGTLTTAAQPNITSVGTLTSLTSSGAIEGTSLSDGTGSISSGIFTGVGVNLSSTAFAAAFSATGGGVYTNDINEKTSESGVTIDSVLIKDNTVNATGGIFTYVSGDGANLSAIAGANVTGEVAFADTANAVAGANVSGEVSFAATANAVAGANVSGEVSFAATANAVAGANVSGTVSDATTAGTVTTAAQPNITSVGTLTGLGVNGDITATNITANTGVFTGDAGGLSNVVGANVTGEVSYAATANAVAGANVSGTVSDATTAGTVTTAAQPNITSVGTLTSLSVTGNASAGNVSGTGGVFTYVSGDGANLTSITGQNVTGEVDFAQVANSVAGANVSGTVSSATTAGTVTTSAQPNITSVGTLSSVTVSGNATVQGNVVTDKVLGRTNANLSITAFSGNNSILLAPTGTGVVDVGAKRVVNGADPTAAKDLATKEYVDTIASASLHYHAPCRVESPTALNASYNNGSSGVGATLTNAGSNAALVVDGITLSTNDRVLVYNQANAVQNGVYDVTTVGDGSTAWVLTRSSDADTYSPSDPDAFGAGDAFYIQEGDTGAGELYVMNTEGTITFGTTNITFVQISSAQIYSAGTGLDLTGVQFSLADTAVSPASYGDSGNVSTFTVDQQGRLTAAGEQAIQAPASGITGSTLSSNVTTSSLTSVGTLGTLSVTGNANVGNIGATNFVGSGASLTSLNASNLSSGTVPSGRLSGTYTITVSGSATTAGTVTTAAQPNITSVGTLSSLSVTGNANVGNVGATNFVGSGASLTSLNGSNITTGTIAAARVATLNQNTTGYAATVSTAAQPNITSVGTLTGLTIAANGDITMSGTGSQISGVALVSSTLFAGSGANLTNLNGSNISSGTIAAARVATLNQNTTGYAATVSSAAQPNITSVGTLSSLSVTGNANIGNVGATNFVGSGASLTSLNGSQITSGTIAAARVATLNQNTTGYAATVSSAAQPNITSVGTLTSLSVSGTATAGTLQSTTWTTGSNSTAGTVTGDFTLTAGSTWNATYADLAEKYTADRQYEPGTVVVFGGDAELSITGIRGHHAVAGVITTNPAQVYNNALEAGEGEFVVQLALIGRVPVRVIGPVHKGDLIIASENAGFGCSANLETDTLLPGAVIGKAISSYNGDTPEGVVEVLVGKN